MTEASSDYSEWLKHNPAPDLQELVQRYGGYRNIPAEAWAQFDEDKADWEARRKLRLKWG